MKSTWAFVFATGLAVCLAMAPVNDFDEDRESAGSESATTLSGDPAARARSTPVGGSGGNVLFDNGGPDGINGLSNFEGVTTDGTSFDRALVDDFELSFAAIVEQVQMSGTWFHGNPAPGPVGSFRVRIFNDDGGSPGATVTDQQGLAFTATNTGASFFGRPEVRYTVGIAPVLLDAETRYWMSIQPTDTGSNFFQLSSATGEENLWGEEVHVSYPDLGSPPWTPGSVHYFPPQFYDATFQAFGTAFEPTLSLNVSGGNQFVEPGDVVAVAVRLTDLNGIEAAGFQAFLSYDEDLLEYLGGFYTSAFGLPIIDPIATGPGTLDLAAGTDVFGGQDPLTSNATVAVLNFLVLQEARCVASVRFRTDVHASAVTDPMGGALEPLSLMSLPAQPPTSDLNGDGVVDVSDLLILLGEWGLCTPDEPCPADLNCDGVVDVSDLLILLGEWG